MKELPSALSAFQAYKQFIVYKVVPSQTRPGKTDKFPIDHATRRIADAHNSSIWLSFQRASDTCAQWGEPFGIGFVFTENDPFWFLDIDNCLLVGGWAPHALQACQLLAGCAVEMSQSGKGLHLFGSGRPPAHKCKNSLDMEFYHTGRFAALTGINAQGDAARDFSPVLPTLVTNYFPPDPSTNQDASIWSETASPEWRGIEEDSELIRCALASKTVASSFGNKASFADLWFADEKALGRAFPDPDRPYDCNKADSALAQHLAFWTGKNCERIRRLMLGSKLVRDKWEREDYLPRTILGVVARQIDVFQAAQPQVSPQALPIGPNAPASPTASQGRIVEGSRYLGPAEQDQLFNGAIYITDSHRVLINGGHVLKPEQFKVHFGGYSFVMDNTNDRTSRDPWEAFTQSQLRRPPMVNGTCFRPDLPAGEIVTRNGQTFVNIYVSVDVPRMEGDPAPFLTHLGRVLPDPKDQLILLSYMAAIVQHKGVNQGKPGKFQWAPLLQGVEGNGKTMFTRCVAEAIGRRYTHWPRASQLAKNFNAWMKDRLFFAVEDIYVPDARREVIEELKPMITGENLEIEAKGIDQASTDICGNFMFNSNHRDAIKKTGNDRRFCVLFSAQQESSHLTRDGMAGDYFPRLYTWLRGDGYAIVSEFLHTFHIPPELNPAGECQRAPVSSTTGEAISASTGTIEQEILESVAQGLPGFNGGWISSIYLDRLLDRMGMRKINHTRRREMLEDLGYRFHPALMDGRVNNAVLPDGGKPRLYVHDTCLFKQLTTGAEVAKCYEASNKNQPHLNAPFELHRRGTA